MGRGRGSAVEGRQRPGRSWDSARQSIHPSEVDMRSPGRPGAGRANREIQRDASRITTVAAGFPMQRRMSSARP